MRFTCILFLLFSISVGLCADTTSVSDTTYSLPPFTIQDEIPDRLGFSLFSVTYPKSNLYAGQISNLSLKDRNLLNLESSVDLISADIRFLQPDFTSDGRETPLSAMGRGAGGTKLIWRNRPMRDPRTGRADFNRVPLQFIGGVSSTVYGSLNGSTSSGGVVEFFPAELKYNQPITALHYRDGYYGYEPVDALHIRRVGESTFLTAGGNFPASDGRFENTQHHGHNLFTELNHYLSDGSSIFFTMMTRRDKTGIAYTAKERSYHDNDWDVNYHRKFDETGELNLNGYRTWRVEKEDEFRAYTREAGIGLHATWNSLGLLLRTSRLDLKLPVDHNVKLVDFESNIFWKRDLTYLDAWINAGAEGWWPDRVKPTAMIGLESKPTRFGEVFGTIQRSVDAHSVEIMYADYRESRPTDDLEPIWRLRQELPIVGRILPVSASQGWELGWKNSFHRSVTRHTSNIDSSGLDPAGGNENGRLAEWMGMLKDFLDYQNIYVEAAYFNRIDIQPRYWGILGDTLITPFIAKNRKTTGWRTSAMWEREPFRGSISMISLNREDEMERGVPVLSEEPSFRLKWEAGWHRKFWDDVFETDVSFSGRFYNEFLAQNPESSGFVIAGGAYPLDFRLTFRISRFSLYYGVHNWNAYPYELVPGYRMMHKEEYFGIHWLLFD